MGNANRTMNPADLDMQGLCLDLDIADEVDEDICIEDDFDVDDEEDDIAFVSQGGESGEDDFFDAIVGKLEEIVMGDNFQNETEAFMQTHCVVFERGEEMKLEYTTLFQQYTSIIENHLMRGLKEAFPELELDQLLALLEADTRRLGRTSLKCYWGCRTLPCSRSKCWNIG